MEGVIVRVDFLYRVKLAGGEETSFSEKNLTLLPAATDAAAAAAPTPPPSAKAKVAKSSARPWEPGEEASIRELVAELGTTRAGKVSVNGKNSVDTVRHHWDIMNGKGRGGKKAAKAGRSVAGGSAIPTIQVEELQEESYCQRYLAFDEVSGRRSNPLDFTVP